MYRKEENQQLTLENRVIMANAQTKNAVEKSRAKMVGDVIYPNVDEDKFAPLYSEKGSRPNINISKYVSALVLKRMYGMSDETLLEFLRCGALNFQYALHTEQDEVQPLSESSLRRFRNGVLRYNKENNCDIIQEEFERISREMAVSMGLLHDDPDDGRSESECILVRMDSMEIEAHAKAMPRLEILYTSNVIMIRYLLKKEFSNVIPAELSHYMEDGDHNQVLYYRASEEEKEIIQGTRIEKAVQEMSLLDKALHTYFTTELLEGIPEYQVFQRVLEEQTEVAADGTRIAKDKSQISADSVQNPFDTTVTYRYKRGPHHGSVLNVAEVHDNEGNGIIVHASLKPNAESDQSMAKEYLEAQPDNGAAQQVALDGGYAGEELEKLAAEKNIALETTSLTGKKPDEVFADFVLNKDETDVLSCPAGKEPISCTYNGKAGIITAVMPDNCCANCPNRERCKAHVNEKKASSRVKVRVQSVKRAAKARKMKTEEHKKIANSRNGVEGIMSVMRRKYGVDRLPVFGIERSKIWIFTSLLAYNLVKLKKYLSLKKQPLAA